MTVDIEHLSLTHLQDCIDDAKANPRIHRTMLVKVWSSAHNQRYLGIGLVKAVFWSAHYLQYVGIVHMAASKLELEVLACNMEQTFEGKLRCVK